MQSSERVGHRINQAGVASFSMLSPWSNRNPARRFVFVYCIFFAGIPAAVAQSPENGKEPSAKQSETAEPTLLDSTENPLFVRVDKAIEQTSRRILDSGLHSPWQIAHGVLALRQHYIVKQGDDRISAIDWIASGPKYQGLPWFLKTEHGGKGHPYVKPMWFEGHPNQFVALFTFCDLPLDFEFTTGSGEQISIADVVRNAKMEVNDYEEVTWTLWFLSHYLDMDEEWENQNGIPWSMDRLVRTQIRSEPTKAACGGTHGLFALAKSIKNFQKQNTELRGAWLEADQHLQRYIQTARSLQNRDGSFSSKYFKGAGSSQELDKRISTTGHTLEFLMMALPSDRLKEDWIRRAVERLTSDLLNSSRVPLEPGGMYHALDGLILYRQRMDEQFSLDQLNLPAATVPDQENSDLADMEGTSPKNEATPVEPGKDSERPAPKGTSSLSRSIGKSGGDPEDVADSDEKSSAESASDDASPESELIQSPRRVGKSGSSRPF